MPDNASRRGSSTPPTERPSGEIRPDELQPDAMRSIHRRVRSITRENERLFTELLAGERRFRQLARSVWRVQEAERRRLARELHDGIGQTLTALKNQLELTRQRGLAASAPAAADLEESLELATRALEETRELSRLLRPPVLDDLGLEAALRWLARTVGRGGEPAIEVEFDAGDRRERLEPELETLVFRVVQEALTNAVKHSGAASAVVRLAIGRERLRLSVADDGAGLDVDEVLGRTDDATGIGLRGIRDRAELHGGRFRLRSAPGEGARLELTLPLVEEESS